MSRLRWWGHWTATGLVIAFLGAMAVLEVASFVTGCHTAPPAYELPPTQVYGELVEAGCIVEDDSGLPAVEADHQKHVLPWLDCLFTGGTVKSCGAPCD